MEIRMKAAGDTPHYLGWLVMQAEGDKIVFQIADQRDTEKARYEIDAAQLRAGVDMLTGNF